MLFENIDEFREFQPFASTADFDKLKPFIRNAERDFIRPAIGKELYIEISAAYKNKATVALTAIQESLLEQIRVPLSNFSFAAYIPWGQVQIESAGIRIDTTSEKKTAFRWQIEQLAESATEQGYTGIEDLLEFLDDEQLSFPTYTASAAFKLSKQFFINSAKAFDQKVKINRSRWLYQQMVPIMEDVELSRIRPLMGKELFEELKAQILDETLTALNLELMDFIVPAVAHLTIARAVIDLPLKIEASGISLTYQKTDEGKGKQPADMQKITAFRTEHLGEGERLLKELKDHLQARADDYPLYKNSTAYVPEGAEVYFKNDPNKGTYAFF